MSILKKVRVIVGFVAVGALAPTAFAATNANAAAKVPLVLYSAQGYDSAIATAFQAKTGITVKLVDDSTGPLLTKVAAEKNNPQWDVLWVDGSTPFAALDKQGQLQDYTPKAKLNALGKSLVPVDHSYIPTGTTVMAALIYNSAKVTSVPATYKDLLAPKYKGMIGMNDPSQSGPTFPFIAGLMNQLGGQKRGVSAGESFFTKLKANDLQVFPTNGDTKHALETGLINYGLIQSSAAVGEVIKFTATPAAGFAPKIAYLPKSTLLPGVIGIDKHVSAAAKAEAEQLVEYILSPAGQAIMKTGDASGDSLFWPVVPGVATLPGLPAIPAYQTINPYFWGPQQGTINTWFDSKIK